MIEQIEKSQRAQYKTSTSIGPITPEEPPQWGKIPSSEYVSRYGKLVETNKTNFLKVAFSNGAAGHSAPLISRSPVNTFPGVFSFDEAPLLFLRELADELDKEFTPDTDDELFSATGIHTGFKRIKCPAGYYANPMSHVSVDNTPYRSDELGLRNDTTPREAAIADEVWNLVWSQATPRPVNVAKLSTGGMRRFTHDVQWKLAYAEWLFEPENFERMLNAVDKDDAYTLANEFEMVFAMYLQKRGQLDEPSKVRKVIDREYAVSAGKKGTERATDKKVVFADGRKYDDFSALRARVVQAGPWTINCFLQAVATCTMHALFTSFPKTFHVNSKEDIKEQVDGKHIFCSDVTEYDRSMPADDIKRAHVTMAEKWDPRIAKASWRLYSAPYYSKPLDVNGGIGAWIGDPTDWSYELKAGNRSGHALTSLVGKVNKVIETLGIIDRLYPVLGSCKKFLEGRGPMGMINNGDDEVVWAYTKEDLNSFKNLRSDVSVGRYVVKPELGQGFSGLLLCRRNPDDVIYHPTPKIHTTFEKLWVPERSIGGIHRKFWTIGVIDRVNNIVSTDIGRAAWDVHMSVYRRMMAPLYGDFMMTVMREHSKINFDVSAYSQKEKEIIDDPSKLHYKYIDSDASDSVLEMVTSKVPLTAVERFVRTYYKGNLK